MIEILQELQICWERKTPAVLATVIAVDGSVYRKQGARCIIREDGRIVGIVSGGCVEKDLYAYAQEAIASGQPRKVDYDFRPEDDALWGLGVGCNGALTIWLQPFDPLRRPEAAGNMLDSFMYRVASETPYSTGMVVESENESVVPLGWNVRLEPLTLGHRERDGSFTLKGVKVKLFVEEVRVRPRLFVLGAGADARPLTRIAKYLEWHVTLVDHREDALSAANFPDADRFLKSDRSSFGDIPLPSGAAVVVMTHNYELDKKALRSLLDRDLLYVGQLGPRKRLDRMLEDLRREGVDFDRERFLKLHSPAGLDIGAETPEEIALCIVAEICARRNRAGGASLREKQLGPVAGL